MRLECFARTDELAILVHTTYSLCLALSETALTKLHSALTKSLIGLLLVRVV